MNLRERIDDFLGQKRLAIVSTEMEGQHCFARLQEVAPPVDGAVLLTSPPLPTR